MALDIGDLVAQVTMDTSDYDRGSKRIRDSADDTSGRLKKVPAGAAALAGAVGGLVATVAQEVMSGIGSMVGEAIEASDATQKFVSTLQFAGLDNSKIDALAKSTRAYADQTVYDLADIQGTTATLAANGVKDYDKLAEAAGNLNAVAGGNKETFKSVASVLTQTAGAGKLTTENWNQIANAIPGASGIIQDALEKNGAFTGNFRDAMSEGQITADEFNEALMELGSDPVAVEAAKSTVTMEGALGNLQATIVGGLSDAITGMKPMLTDLIGGLSSFVGDFIGFVKDAVGVAGEIIEYVKANMDWIGPLASAIGAIAAVWLVWNGALLAWQTITKIGAAVQLAFNAVMAANPIMLIVMAIAALVAGLVYFFTQTELGQQVWAEFTRFLGEAWENIVTGFEALMGFFDGIPAWWEGVWTAVSTFFEDLWAGITTFFQGAVDGIVTFVQEHWGLLLSFLIGPIGLAIQWIVENWAGIMKWFRDVIGGFVGWWGDTWTGIKTTITDIWNGIVSWITGVVDGFARFMQDAWAGYVGFWSGLWNGIKTTIVDIWEGIVDWFEGIPQAIKDVFSGAASWLYNIGRDVIDGFFRGLKDVAGQITGWFESTFGGIIDTVAGIFDINSPSKVFRGIGLSVGEGFVQGLDRSKVAVDGAVSDLFALPPVAIPNVGIGGAHGAPGAAQAAYAAGAGTTFIYNAAENQSLSSEEALYAALGGPRSPFGGAGVAA